MKDYSKLKNLVPESILYFDESMKKHTTMKVGGNAKCLVAPTNINEIVAVLKFSKENNIDVFVIGNGSNVIVDDSGIDGIVLKISNKFSNIEVNDDKITALAGASMPLVSLTAKNNGLSGLEFACGIPGTIGGGARMNAGAYGSEMSNVIEKIKYIDEDLNLKEILSKDCKFSYRHSIFSENTKNIILEVTYHLEHADKKDIEEKMEEYKNLRISKQPLEYPNSGSIFRRPEGYFVGKLVQDSGLKGKTIGGAQVSTKHTGFIVNIGNATCKDVKELIKFIQDTVFEKYNVKLETEVEFIGGNK
mgnify:FL=1